MFKKIVGYILILVSFVLFIASYEFVSKFIPRGISFLIHIFVYFSMVMAIDYSLRIKDSITEYKIKKMYIGRWKSNENQMIFIFKIPLTLILIAIYKPNKGRVRVMPCLIMDNQVDLLGALTLLHLLDTMLVLSVVGDMSTKKEVLVPSIESGPETNLNSWYKDDHGFPWLYPLSLFYRVN